MTLRPQMLGVIPFLISASQLYSQQTELEYSPRKVVPFAIRAITDPKIADAADVDISAAELVLGVTINGKSRAYPINQLTGPHREIINDELGGVAIAATW